MFGCDDLVAARREPWDGIRNYQSRNHLRAMRKGDEAIFYHSSTNPPGAAGICKIVKEAEPDPTQFDPMATYYDPASKPDMPLGHRHRRTGAQAQLRAPRRAARHAGA